MPATKPHGHKRRNDFKAGQLVRWNHWKSRDDWYKDPTGKMRWHTYIASDLGIVLDVWKNSNNCYLATVNFVDGKETKNIPLNCLEVTDRSPTTRVVPG